MFCPYLCSIRYEHVPLRGIERDVSGSRQIGAQCYRVSAPVQL